MKSLLENSYPFRFIGKNEKNVYIYEFDSIGEIVVKKRVKIFVLDKSRPDIFNLGLVNEELNDNDEIIESDTSNKNNKKDWEKVLNTTFLCCIDFIRSHDWASILFFGNTNFKQLIYKRKIALNLGDLATEFSVFGVLVSYDLIYMDQLGNEVSTLSENFEERKNTLTKKPKNVLFKGFEPFKKTSSKNYGAVLIRKKVENK